MKHCRSKAMVGVASCDPLCPPRLAPLIYTHFTSTIAFPASTHNAWTQCRLPNSPQVDQLRVQYSLNPNLLAHGCDTLLDLAGPGTAKLDVPLIIQYIWETGCAQRTHCWSLSTPLGQNTDAQAGGTMRISFRSHDLQCSGRRLTS